MSKKAAEQAKTHKYIPLGRTEWKRRLADGGVLDACAEKGCGKPVADAVHTRKAQ